MYDLLELLYSYSANERIADRDFIDHVLSYYWVGLKGYLERLSFKKINQDELPKNIFSPMAYSFYEKAIIIDEDIIKQNFVNVMLRYQTYGLDQFSRVLAYNADTLFSLLHEIDHAVQHKKSVENNGSFESLLLRLCFYPEIEFLTRANLTKLKIYFTHSNLVDMVHTFIAINKKFDHTAPYERLTQIDSAKQILGLLEVFNADVKNIPDVLKVYKDNLLTQYKMGYEKKNAAPLISYIEEIKKLNYKELNSIIKKLEDRFNEIETVDDKIRFGLSVTEREFDGLKRRTLR